MKLTCSSCLPGRGPASTTGFKTARFQSRPSEVIINELIFTSYETKIAVILDDVSRTLVVPGDEKAIHNRFIQPVCCILIDFLTQPHKDFAAVLRLRLAEHGVYYPATVSPQFVSFVKVISVQDISISFEGLDMCCENCHVDRGGSNKQNCRERKLLEPKVCICVVRGSN